VAEEIKELGAELGVTRRLFEESEAASRLSDVVEVLCREFSEDREGDPAGEAAPSVKASRMRSNLRFFVSIAYDMLRSLRVWFEDLGRESLVSALNKE